MLIRLDRVAATTLSSLALTSSVRAACDWEYDLFTAPTNKTYALGQCGHKDNIDSLRAAFVTECNATVAPDVDTDYWKTIKVWYPVFLDRKEHEARDEYFVNCLEQIHAELTSDAPKGARVGAAAALLGACAALTLAYM